VHADPVDPVPVVDLSTLLTDFTEATAARLLALAGHGSGSPLVEVEVRQLGGVYARDGAHPSAFCHRAARYCVLVIGMAPDPTARPHAERLLAALADWDTGAVWPNFGPPHDARTAGRAYDPATLARLVAVTRTYDPHGVLQTGAYTGAGAS